MLTNGFNYMEFSLRRLLGRRQPHTILRLECNYPGFEHVEISAQLPLQDEHVLQQYLQRLAIRYAVEHNIAKWQGQPLKVDVIVRYQYLITTSETVLPTYAKLAAIGVTIPNRDSYTPEEQQELIRYATEKLKKLPRNFMHGGSLFFVAGNMVPNPYRGNLPLREAIRLMIDQLVKGAAQAVDQIQKEDK